ncbi:craniofacial development protein 2-like protein [Plakobranchus ocellatus]|uniref:Craniofacial development protein 2-like protein n=1 Tax=Plakobranchus ocellatus TaxID=259542 RepID=A0AAV3YJD8_9GAST|nr:craniofacial development protein 2-like protein [Plakobranchus ocellatus]
MSRMMSGSTMTESRLESTVPSEGTPSSLGIVQFGFHAKTSYDADEALLQTRSENFKVLPGEKDRDIWKRPPPDFRYVVYDPRPPKRNTVDSVQPWNFGTIPGQREIVKKIKDEGKLPRLFEQRQREPEIITRFHIDRPFTAKKKFVREGMNPAGSYENPKLHDYRQVSAKLLLLQEFLLGFHGLPSDPPERDLAAGRQMAPAMSAKKKWDSQLILDKTKWPQKNEAFTRYRLRHRQPYSAFMERVERDLSYKWSREQMDKALQESS